MSDHNLKRAALYLRVSTVDQNPEMQRIELRQLVQQRGWRIVYEYVDHGISGARERRPQLDRLLKDVHRGQVDVVVVWAFDRMARSVHHLLDVLAKLQAANVQFVSLRESIDTAGPLGRAVTIIIGAIAELERSLIVERVKAGMRRAKLEGRRLGRPPLPDVDRNRIRADREEMGYSFGRIAQLHGISKTSVIRILQAGPKSCAQRPM